MNNPVITSAPALAAALRVTDTIEEPAPLEQTFAADSLVPMYQIDTDGADAEAQSAAHVVSEIAERLRRLAAAYGEWTTFDAPAYFDLTAAQAARLVRISERVSTVYVIFFADLLLPAFRQAETFWADDFLPTYHITHPQHDVDTWAYAIYFQQHVQPKMVAYWHYLMDILQQTRSLLADDIGFLSTNCAPEERMRWRRAWERTPAAGLDMALQPALNNIPTLSLAFEFPLPTHRQSGRLRRLRRNRERRRRFRRG